MPLFPFKLHDLLTEMQSNASLSSIISWTPSGNAFKIHEPIIFQEILLPKYFPRQTQMSSFKRQLLYYGFDNLDDGIFAHPSFLKNKRHLCAQINHTNPTKSQREAKASIPSRRIRGKRAKHALRQKLEVSAACKADIADTKATISVARSASSIPSGDSLRSAKVSKAPDPRPLSTIPLHTLIPEGQGRQFSFSPALVQYREMPTQYWGRLNASCEGQGHRSFLSPAPMQSLEMAYPYWGRLNTSFPPPSNILPFFPMPMLPRMN